MKAAAQVMIFNVYGLDEAFSMVRLHAGSSVEGMTSGNSEPNSSTMVATIAKVVSRNAQPSRSSWVKITTPTRATAPMPTIAHVHPVP